MALWSKTPTDAPEDEFLAFRQVDPAYPPLWYGAGATTLSQESGRWHQKGYGVAQYMSLSSNGAWAELVRYEEIRDENRRVEQQRCLWQMQVARHRIADLRSFDKYLDSGLKPEWAIGPHQDCWPLAAELVNEGFDGVLSPSAALDAPEAVNLTLFDQRMETYVRGGMPDPGDNPDPRFWLPTIQITDSGPPPASVIQNTCYETGKHRTFAKWCRDNGYAPGP